MNRTTATRPMVAALAAVVSLALAACAAPASPVPAATASGSAFPVTVTNELGTVEVKQRPERVVAVGLSELDNALALGVTPVAYGAFGDADLYDYQSTALAHAAAPQRFDLTDGVSLEKIGSYDPDLVINLSWGSPEVYRDLNSFVPVVSWVSGPFADDWKTQVEQIAPALGLAEQGKQMIVALEASVVAARQANPVLQGKKVTYATTAPAGVCVVDLPGAPALTLLQDLGLTPNPDFLDPKSAYCKEVSLENLRDIDADLIIMLSSAQERRSLEARPTFKSLTAAQQGRVVWLDSESAQANALNSPTLLSLPVVLDDLVPQFASAME